MGTVETIIRIGTLITLVVTILGLCGKMWHSIAAIKAGQRCLMRTDMLTIYYKNRESKTLKQYEKENFLYLYEAYKNLGGNSFIEDICAEVREWEVISR